MIVRGYLPEPLWGLILRDASLCDAPQDEGLDPHGEERGNTARLEP